MFIEYTNAKSHPTRSFAVTFFVVSATVFLFIPTTLIVLGYYSTQPTGNLISPLPQGVISQNPTPTPPLAETPNENQLVIAADNTSTPSSVTQNLVSNSTSGQATLPATKAEIKIENTTVKEYSQILISPQGKDKSIYFVKSKANGSFVLSADSATTFDRTVDYQIVNP